MAGSAAVERSESGDVWYERCLSCGGSGVRALSGYDRHHLVRCQSCGLTFAGRRPSDAEISEHYRGYGHWPDLELTRQRYRELLDTLEPFRGVGRLLDMGSGAGYFLEEAARRGWDAHGTEFSGTALDMSRAKGLNVVQAPITEETFPAGHFDVITAFEVVEHLRDPQEELRLIRRMLRPGGLFYCTTPNFASLTRRLVGARWTTISYPEHLIYFTDATLTSWLGSAGFTPQSVISTGFSPGTFRASLRPRRSAAATPAPANTAADASAADPSPSFDERLRRLAARTPALETLKDILNRLLTRLHGGDTLKGRFIG
jgi:SAM-dependent methyltransferase